MRKNRLIALIGTLTMAAAGVAAFSTINNKPLEVKAVDPVSMFRLYVDECTTGMGDNLRLESKESGNIEATGHFDKSFTIAGTSRDNYDTPNGIYYFDFDVEQTSVKLKNGPYKDYWDVGSVNNNHTMIQTQKYGTPGEKGVFNMYRVVLHLSDSNVSTEYWINWGNDQYIAPDNSPGYKWVYTGTNTKYTQTTLIDNIELTQVLNEPFDGYYAKIFNAGEGKSDLYYLADYGGDQFVGIVSLNKGDEFKIVKYENESITRYYANIETGDGSAPKAGQISGGGTGDNPPNIKAEVTGEYIIYFKHNYGYEYHSIWIPRTEIHEYSIKNLTTDKSYPLVLNTGLEYMTNTEVSFNANDSMAVYDSVDGGEPVLLNKVNAKNVSNNNLSFDGSKNNVITSDTSKVYVDFMTSSIFYGSFKVNNYYMAIMHSNNTFEYVALKYNESPAQNFREYYTENIYDFSSGDILSFIDTTDGDGKTHAVAFDVGEVAPDSVVKGFEGFDSKIKSTTSIKSLAYLKLGINSEANHNMVYFTNPNLQNAIEFAKGFNSEMGNICDKSQHSGWNDQIGSSWTTEKESFQTLNADAKDFIKEATASSLYEDLASFAPFYDYIYSKYNSTHSDVITDFASRFANGGAGVLSYGSTNQINLISNVETSTWIIVAIFITGIAAVGVFFIYRKRKEN